MPSAGRAFTPELLTRLIARGVQIAPHAAVTGRVSRELGSAPTWLLWCLSQAETASYSAPYLLLLNYPTFCASGDRIACKP
jgi:hypothetical protein